MFTEEVVKSFTVREEGTVEVLLQRYILEDGVRIAGPLYHRYAYDVNSKIPEDEDEKIKTMMAHLRREVHTKNLGKGPVSFEV